MSEINKEENNKENKEILEKEQEDVVDASGKEPKEEIKEKTVEEKLKESEEKLLRSLAEIENQRRRFEKEIKDAFEFGSFNFAKESLAILDNLQRAKDAIKNDEKLKDNKDLDKFLENINIIKKDLVSIFERNRIIKIDTNKKKFDPNFHQAMLEVEDHSKESGLVVQEIQKGYMMKGRLLRPSMVGVTKKSEKNSEKGVNNSKKSEEK